MVSWFYTPQKCGKITSQTAALCSGNSLCTMPRSTEFSSCYNIFPSRHMQFPYATPSAVKVYQAHQCWADQLGEPIPKVRLLISYLTLLMWLISSRICTEKRQRRMASWGIQDLTCRQQIVQIKQVSLLELGVSCRLFCNFLNKTLNAQVWDFVAFCLCVWFCSCGGGFVLVFSLFVDFLLLFLGLVLFFEGWKNLKILLYEAAQGSRRLDTLIQPPLLVWDIPKKRGGSRMQV